MFKTQNLSTNFIRATKCDNEASRKIKIVETFSQQDMAQVLYSMKNLIRCGLPQIVQWAQDTNSKLSPTRVSDRFLGTCKCFTCLSIKSSFPWSQHIIPFGDKYGVEFTMQACKTHRDNCVSFITIHFWLVSVVLRFAPSSNKMSSKWEIYDGVGIVQKRTNTINQLDV